MIGRCSVDDTEQVQNVVHKILNFKPDKLTWNNKMTVVIDHDTGHYQFYS